MERHRSQDAPERVRMFGSKGKRYGIWNRQRRCWEYDICEDTPMLAEARFLFTLGTQFDTDRFVVKELPPDVLPKSSEASLIIQRKDMEIRKLKQRIAQLLRQGNDSGNSDQEPEIQFYDR